MRLSLNKERQREEELSENLSKELEYYQSLSKEVYPYQLWQRIAKCNLKLQELKPNYYYETIKLMEDFYMNEEPLFKSMHLKDDYDSAKSFKWRVLNNLKDSTSIIALNEAGVLVLVEVPKNYLQSKISRPHLVHGTCHKRYVQLTSSLTADFDPYAMFGCHTFLRIYAICIRPSYRHMGLGIKLFETAVYVAQSLKIPMMMGIFTDSCLQVLAKKIGMEEIKHIDYDTWKNYENQEVFPNLRKDHRYCALMMGKVPSPPPPPAPNVEIPIEIPKKEKKKP